MSESDRAGLTDDDRQTIDEFAGRRRFERKPDDLLPDEGDEQNHESTGEKTA